MKSRSTVEPHFYAGKDTVMVQKSVIRRIAVGTAVATAIALTIPIAAQAATPPPTSSAAAKGGNVIVLLRNQHTNLKLDKGTKSSPRTKAYQSDQSPIIADAKSSGAKNVHGFTSVNAVAATVTAPQAAALASDPAVQAVVPDLAIKASPTPVDTGKVSKSDASSPTAVNSTICPADPAKPLLEPEALQTTNTAFSDTSTPQAQNYVDGSGTKVAYIADGIDVNNPDFIRANGEHVFVDYKDFSGEGWDAPSSAAEAFGDASAIAAQGLHTYDLSDWVSAAHPLPAGCNIQVRGIAPGASLVGLKVFGNSNTAPTSRFIEAIDYAVSSGVDVLNESFGGNPYPDTMNDPISLADDAAIAAGVTVVSSTGDAGVTGTIGSPGTSPGVIAVGATTTFRSYAQTTGSGFQFSNGTWVSNNISGLSSGGTSSSGKTPDLAAPGDLGWALCSPNTAVYEDCTTADGAPASIQDFGGTSQSSPLTAGAAALVIEAYEHAHGGAKPTPAVVKQILTSTATDLGHPAYEQGAGELNTLKAVQAAMSWKDANGSGTPTGSALTVDKTQLALTSNPGFPVSGSLTVTNRGTKTQSVSASTRALTKTVGDQTGSTTLNTASAPAYIDGFGIPRSYAKVTFTVGANVDRLTVLAAGALPSGFALRTILIDPKGVYTAYSIPQGASNGARSEVASPVAGTWTAYIAMSRSSGFNGTLKWEAIQQKYTSSSIVLPSSFTLAPGQSRQVAFATREPSSPGDLSASLQLNGSVSGVTSVPVTLRAVIPARNYSFSGSLSAGNGRQFFGQAQTYYLDVPRGQKDLGVGVKPSDTGNLIFATLTAPNGQTYSWNSNEADGTGVQDYVRSPAAGRWMFTVEAADPVSGSTTRSGYDVSVRYNTVKISAPALPHNAHTTLKQGAAVTVPVKITNTGVAPLTYFTDARLDQVGTINLATLNTSSDTIALPDTETPEWLVPTHTSAFAVTGVGSQPVNIDMQWQGGDPEIYAAAPATGTTTTVGLAADTVAPGFWVGNIGQTGPFDGPATPGTVALSAAATGQLFDLAVTSPTGDFQTAGAISQSSSSPFKLGPILKRIEARHDGQSAGGAPGSAPVVDGPPTLQPGQSATVLVTITPSAAKGSVVKGHLYIDTLDPFLGNSDELIDLPYTYKVG